jgi:hypothetical protein
MRALSFFGIFLLDGLLFVVKLLLTEIYVSERIYWGLPLVALLSSFMFLFSAEVTQSTRGILGIFFLAIYGTVVLTVRIRKMNHL